MHSVQDFLNRGRKYHLRILATRWVYQWHNSTTLFQAIPCIGLPELVIGEGTSHGHSELLLIVRSFELENNVFNAKSNKIEEMNFWKGDCDQVLIYFSLYKIKVTSNGMLVKRAVPMSKVLFHPLTKKFCPIAFCILNAKLTMPIGAFENFFQLNASQR